MAPLFPHIFVCRTLRYATRLTDSKPSAISTVLYTLNFLTDETTELFIQNNRGNFVLYTICPRISLSFHIFKIFDSAKYQNQRMRFNASFRCLPTRNNSVFPWYGGTGTCESNAKHHHSGHPEEENVVARLHQIQREKSTADKKDK
jgi:hypothetical protein